MSLYKELNTFNSNKLKKIKGGVVLIDIDRKLSTEKLKLKWSRICNYVRN